MQELDRCRTEYADAQAAAAECDAKVVLEIQDARLLRVRLSAILQRYKERKPTISDLASPYEAELDGLQSELKLLKEENGLLAMCDTGLLDASNATRDKPRGSRSRPLTVAEELHREACELRISQSEGSRIARQTQIAERSLEAMKDETKRTTARFKAQEQQLADLRNRHIKGEAYLKDLLEAQVQVDQELEAERAILRELHRQALHMRESCYVPAKLKKETTFLMKLMQHEGGRLKKSRHLRSLEACKRMYDEIAVTAPNLLPLAGRAKAEMEEEFARYLKLEESHGRALQRLQLAVTRGLQRP